MFRTVAKAPGNDATVVGKSDAARSAPGGLPAHPARLVPERLRVAGLDFDYEALTEPALVAALNAACSQCAHPERCARDFAAPSANDVVAGYCPNTPVIDDLVIERATGKTR